MAGSQLGRREPAAGSPHPLGTMPQFGGVNFSVYSRHATQLELLLYHHADDARPAQVIKLDARRHRTWHYWHVFVPGIGPGQIYAWRWRSVTGRTWTKTVAELRMMPIRTSIPPAIPPGMQMGTATVLATRLRAPGVAIFRPDL